MGPENPPRRSKSDQEPLTIDLEASSVASDEKTETAAEQTLEATATEPATAVSEDVASRIAEDNAAEAERVATEAQIDASETADDARTQAAAAAFAEEPDHTETYSQAAAHQPPPKTSSSGALAAGILGGLITLLAAGGLQYAGIFPSLSPERASSDAGLSAEIEAIKTQLAQAPAASAPADLGPLEQRLAALEKSPAGGADSAALKAQVDSLTNELAALKSELADARQSTQASASELASRLDAAEKKIEEPASDVQLARAVAVTALKTAIDRGGPFLAELDALKSVSADDPAVSGLAGDAATGVVSRADLVRDFPAVADSMLAATRGTDPNQGIFGRLVDSASSAIRVRPVGSVEGTAPEAIVARIENKLANGDLKGAALEWETLPAEAKSADEGFKAKLDQRLRVEGLIDSAVAGAMTAKQG
ncbi:COG4223 family protein [Pararhizobium arenae]|uniref:COG4223 family protein n=1 Tax=Pararhizobium arenae TaxID=1856850 RepID=UPI00094B14E7|nr:COG4223 family protein [Pararhizobium arenae]